MTDKVHSHHNKQRTHKKSTGDQREIIPEAIADVSQAIQLLRTHPQQMNPRQILQLQRTIGNKQVASLLKKSIQRDEVDEADGTVDDPSSKKYRDFDGKQYRVTGKDPNRKIQEVKRMDMIDGTVYYVALGEVINFEGSKPVVKYYNKPQDLGDWYPSVTHVNGMNVKPEGGIKDALLLQQTLNEEIDNGGDDVAIGQDAIDVLYTYSSTFNFAVDVYDCVKGKLGFNDTVILMQKQIILDAVHNKQKTHISAHSRGTIKTDNAVREAYAQLSEEFIPIVMEEIGGSVDLTPENQRKVQQAIKEIAQARASEEMNEYINLVYAGNAVEFPSSVLPVDFVVGSYDAISLLVGTYTEWGIGNWGLFNQGNDKSTMTDISHGHGYEGYIPTVAELIGKEILKEK